MMKASALLSLSYTDRVISRSLQSCAKKAHTVDSSTRPYFVRYASFAIELLQSRLDATEKTWFPLLSKYDIKLGERCGAHEALRRTAKQALETLRQEGSSNNKNFEADLSQVLTTLSRELEPVITTETALLEKIGPNIVREDIGKLEEEDKKRRLGLMKKDGHLWCATYLMRSLTAEERGKFLPGIPNVAKSAMLMAGNWQFSRLVAHVLFFFL